MTQSGYRGPSYLTQQPPRYRTVCFEAHCPRTDLVPGHVCCPEHHGARGPCTRYLDGRYCGFVQGRAA